MKRRATQPSQEPEQDLLRRLELAEHTIEAIRAGAVDAFIMHQGEDERVFQLETAWQPYRALIESMGQGALMVSCDGTVLFANRFFLRLVGGTRDTVPGTTLAAWAAAEDAILVDQALAAGRDREADIEVDLKGADGRRVPVRITVCPIGGGENQPLCLTIADLTERKEYEALQRAQLALRKSEARLLEADRRKDEFLATLAHELRNPLVPLRNGLKIVEMAADAETTRRAREMMRRQLQHIVRLVDDLVDVSRITLGKVELQLKPVQLDELLGGALEAVQPLIDEAHHQVRLKSERPLYVEGDAVRLTQVFTNILNNAARYTPPGGRIDVVLEQSGDDAVVRVTDTGRGIAADALPRVFDLFTRMSPDGPETPGLGVGLSIARQLAGMHGGSIEAQSDGPGQGAEFIVRLPLAEPARERQGGAPRATARSGPPMAASGGRHRVLIAEDNEDASRSMALMLRMAGHDVREAHDGATAFDLAEWFRPHLVFLDIRMPAVDGLEVARRIRGKPWGRQMRLVGVTGWGPQSAEAVTRAGLDEILFKPVEPDALLALVKATPIDAYPREDAR